ncbi:MAG TPA: PEP-CTERM sorting domain-containing protein [Sedimentisphaerales bacterium]|nr:PEP-CTERM sorting domain-containing protein [Sedimentisphaerales bacterium]
MKRFTVICVCLALTGWPASPAGAETWLVTSGVNTWLSNGTVPPGLPQYDYEWTLAQAEILVDWPGEPDWQNILDLLEIEKMGSGSEQWIPFQLAPIEIRLDGAEPIVSADIWLGAAVVDGQGRGTAHLDAGTLELGQFGGYDVLDARFGGDFTVTPEPATIVLLSLGSLVLLRKR